MPVDAVDDEEKSTICIATSDRLVVISSEKLSERYNSSEASERLWYDAYATTAMLINIKRDAVANAPLDVLRMRYRAWGCNKLPIMSASMT